MQILVKVTTKFGVQTTAFANEVLAMRAKKVAEAQGFTVEVSA